MPVGQTGRSSSCRACARGAGPAGHLRTSAEPRRELRQDPPLAGTAPGQRTYLEERCVGRPFAVRGCMGDVLVEAVAKFCGSLLHTDWSAEAKPGAFANVMIFSTAAGHGSFVETRPRPRGVCDFPSCSEMRGKSRSPVLRASGQLHG